MIIIIKHDIKIKRTTTKPTRDQEGIFLHGEDQ